MADDNTPDETTDEMPEPDGRTEPEPTVNAEDVRKMQASMRRANKEAETLRLKLREFEDAGKSELEKITGRLTETERRAADAEMALQRYRIGVAKGVPPELIGRLQGDTETEMVEDAERLAEMWKPAARNGTAVPTGPHGGGPAPSMNDRIRRKAGRA